MRVKDVKLEWYVLNSDFNSDSIISYNVFYDTFKEQLYKSIKNKEVTNKEELYTYIDNWARRQYWARTEYEIACGGLCSKYPDKFDKIDIYTQLKPNMNIIVDYVINALKIDFESK